MSLTTRAIATLLSMPPSAISRIVGPPPVVEGNTLDPSVHLLLQIAEVIGGGRPREVAARREGLRKDSMLVMPPVPEVAVSEHVLSGAIGARAYHPHRNPAPLLMYLHGGGWVVGDLDSHDRTCRMLALHSGCTVVSVDYALAPEHVFPAGLADATAAFDELSAHPEEFGGLPGPVCVAGDSAGGNLAAALCLSRQPGALALIYPATDLRMVGASIATFAQGYYLTLEDMLWYRALYLPDLDLVLDPRASPLLADDVSGFPPTAIWTAGFDPIRDDGAAFASRLREAGVTTSYSCYGDQVHGFLGMGVLPGGMRRIAEVGRDIGRLVRAAA